MSTALLNCTASSVMCFFCPLSSIARHMSVWVHLSSSKLCNISLHRSLIIYFSSHFFNGHLDFHSIIISKSKQLHVEMNKKTKVEIGRNSLPAYSDNVIKVNIVLGRGVQASGVSGPYWKKKGCPGPWIKYTNTDKNW